LTNDSATRVLRHRGHKAHVTNTELFFDLVYVFAVTQLSHFLLHDLSPVGALEALLLWFPVWLGWQYTAWVTNWFDPDARPVRLMLFCVMAVAMVMAAALPQAFGERGLVFALCYALIQVGRTVYVLALLGPAHPLTPNLRRILGWLSVSALLWVVGGVAHGPLRFALWACAIACEYFSPMVGFAFPGLGRSRTRDWTIEGEHLAERCQLFVIVALGESILVTGATFSASAHWDAPSVIAFAVAFIGSLAMWWIYFNTGSRHGGEAIARSEDPGRIGALFHYFHVLIVAGVIVCAVADELMLAHPDGRIEAKYAATLIGGPVLYLLGNGWYKRVIYGNFPLSHLAGLGLLALLFPVAWLTDLLMVGGLVTVILIIVAAWETVSRRSIASSKPVQSLSDPP
jgi:low temperature requirement protein LtrA